MHTTHPTTPVPSMKMDSRPMPRAEEREELNHKLRVTCYSWGAIVAIIGSIVCFMFCSGVIAIVATIAIVVVVGFIGRKIYLTKRLPSKVTFDGNRVVQIEK